MAGVRIERHAVVEPGSVVADGVPANAIVRGNPARIVGYVGGAQDARRATGAARGGCRRVEPRARRRDPAAHAHRRPARQPDGDRVLAAARSRQPASSLCSRCQGEHIRGSHAHRTCHQFLVCAAGTLSCVVDDGETREEILLDHPGVGLYLPPMIWGTQYKYSADAVLLVLASHAVRRCGLHPRLRRVPRPRGPSGVGRQHGGIVEAERVLELVLAVSRRSRSAAARRR